MNKRLMILLLAMILYAFMGCQDTSGLQEFKNRLALEEANKALAERYIKAASKADIKLMKEILSPDYIHHPQLGVDESLDEALSGIRQRVTMFPDQSFHAEDLIITADKFVWRGIFQGTHTGNIKGFPATGRKVEIEGFQIFRVENGKIVEGWGCKDLLSLYRQLGFELQPKEEK